jgi:hypothetical protein
MIKPWSSRVENMFKVGPVSHESTSRWELRKKYSAWESNFNKLSYRGDQISLKNTYKISRFLALALKILPVLISPNVPISPNLPISSNFFEIYNSNYFWVSWMTSLSTYDFPKSSLFNFYMIALGRVLNSTHFGDLLPTKFVSWIYCETPNKI